MALSNAIEARYLHGWAGSASSRVIRLVARPGSSTGYLLISNDATGGDGGGGGTTLVTMRGDCRHATIDEASRADIRIDDEVVGLFAIGESLPAPPSAEELQDEGCVAIMRGGDIFVVDGGGSESLRESIVGNSKNVSVECCAYSVLDNKRHAIAVVTSDRAGADTPKYAVEILCIDVHGSTGREGHGDERAQASRMGRVELKRGPAVTRTGVSGATKATGTRGSVDAVDKSSHPIQVSLSASFMTVLWSDGLWASYAISVHPPSSSSPPSLSARFLFSRVLSAFRPADAAQQPQRDKGAAETPKHKRKKGARARASAAAAAVAGDAEGRPGVVMRSITDSHVAFLGASCTARQISDDAEASRSWRSLLVVLDCSYGVAHDFCMFPPSTALAPPSASYALNHTIVDGDPRPRCLCSVGTSVYAVDVRNVDGGAEVSLASTIGSMSSQSAAAAWAEGGIGAGAVGAPGCVRRAACAVAFGRELGVGAPTATSASPDSALAGSSRAGNIRGALRAANAREVESIFGGRPTPADADASLEDIYNSLGASSVSANAECVSEAGLEELFFGKTLPECDDGAAGRMVHRISHRIISICLERRYDALLHKILLSGTRSKHVGASAVHLYPGLMGTMASRGLLYPLCLVLAQQPHMGVRDVAELARLFVLVAQRRDRHPEPTAGMADVGGELVHIARLYAGDEPPAMNWGRGVTSHLHSSEYPLLSLIGCRIEPVVLQAALTKLGATECFTVLDVIARLMSTQTHRHERAGGDAENRADNGPAAAADESVGSDSMPLDCVIAWSSALIDAKFAELSTLNEARGLFSRLSSSIRMHIKHYQRLSPLGGSIAHVERKAQLPPKRGTVSKVYSVELLRLG